MRSELFMKFFKLCVTFSGFILALNASSNCNPSIKNTLKSIETNLKIIESDPKLASRVNLLEVYRAIEMNQGDFSELCKIAKELDNSIYSDGGSICIC
jgi:hypothetical protein